MAKTELFDKEALWYKQSEADFHAAAYLHEEILHALERLYSQLPWVPKAYSGVCSNCFGMLDDLGEAERGIVYSVLAYIGAHWAGAVRYGYGAPCPMFCGEVPREELWEGRNRVSRTLFIEFAINFLKESTKPLMFNGRQYPQERIELSRDAALGGGGGN